MFYLYYSYVQLIVVSKATLLGTIVFSKFQWPDRNFAHSVSPFSSLRSYKLRGVGNVNAFKSNMKIIKSVPRAQQIPKTIDYFSTPCPVFTSFAYECICFSDQFERNQVENCH